MNNIFKNSFYDNDALPKWNFEVSFIFNDPNIPTEYADLLSKAVTNAKIPELRIEKIDTYLPGLHYAYPSKPSLNGEITFSSNDDDKLTIRRIVNHLMQANYNPRFQQHAYFDNGTNTYISQEYLADVTAGEVDTKFDIYISIFNSSNSLVKSIVYKNCFVKSIGSLELDYSSEDLVKTDYTISYPYFKVL